MIPAPPWEQEAKPVPAPPWESGGAATVIAPFPELNAESSVPPPPWESAALKQNDIPLVPPLKDVLPIPPTSIIPSELPGTGLAKALISGQKSGAMVKKLAQDIWGEWVGSAPPADMSPTQQGIYQGYKGIIGGMLSAIGEFAPTTPTDVASYAVAPKIAESIPGAAKWALKDRGEFLNSVYELLAKERQIPDFAGKLEWAWNRVKYELKIPQETGLTPFDINKALAEGRISQAKAARIVPELKKSMIEERQPTMSGAREDIPTTEVPPPPFESAPPAKIEPTLPPEAARAPGVPAETLKTAPVTPEPAETTLMQEALKYKSPEEFVKKQGNLVYRSEEGSPRGNIKGLKTYGDGIYFTDNKSIAEIYGNPKEYVVTGNPKLIKANDPKYIDIRRSVELKGLFNSREEFEYQVGNAIKQAGYDGVIGLNDIDGVVLFNKSYLKPKSQLTDIWKKAHEVPATVPAPPWEAPQGEIVSRETKVNQLEGTIGVEMEAVPSAQAAEGVQTTAMTPPPQPGIVPVSGAPQTPQSVSSQIADIVRSSKSAFEAQKRIKDLGFDVSYEEVKNAESLMKGGGTPDFSQHVMESLIKEMKQRVPGVEADYGLGSMGDITADDIADSLSIFDIAKEKVQNMATAIKHAMNSLEMPQNYLYAHEDSRPIAEGVIDANVKDMKMLHDVAKAVHKCKQVDNPAKIAEILNKADRNPAVDAMAELDKALAEKSITERDKDAVVNGFLVLHRFVRNQLIRDVMLSRFGVRITSNGIMHFVEYTLKNGEKRTDWVEGDKVEDLKKKYQVKVGGQKESIIIKRRSLETGEYIKKEMMVDSYEQAKKLMAQEEQAVISELMPYGEGNYIPHGRMKGKFWVETFETMMDGTTQKISSIRVPDQTTANAFAKAIQNKIPMVEVKVKPHDSKMKNIPSMGSMMDVMLFLDKAGVEPTSETGQRVINAYRAMSPLMSRLIHDKNLPGYRMDWDGMVEGMQMIAEAAARRSYRLDIRDLNGLLKNVQDEWRHNVAFKYLDALANTSEGNPVLNATRALTYFWLLANKPSYIIQNLTEPIWALARITNLNFPVQFWFPLGSGYKALLARAEHEGLLNPFVIYEERSKNLLEHMNVLGNMSESFSSRVVFNLGLRVARDKGLVGDAAYREAYQFLYNVGKPFYSQANKPIAFIGKGWENVRKFGFIVLNWTIDFINKFVRSNAKAMFNTVLAWIILAGFGTLPGGRKLMEKIRGRRFPRNARSMSMKEKFMLGGLSGMMGMSPYFLVPGAIKGGGGISVASPFRSITILQTQLERAYKDSKKYGILGAAQYAPLGGLQYGISGYLKTTKGFRERSGKSMRTFYKPRTLAEKLVTALSLTPFPVGEKYSRKK